MRTVSTIGSSDRNSMGGRREEGWRRSGRARRGCALADDARLTMMMAGMHYVATGWRGRCALRRRVLASDGRPSLCGVAHQVGCAAPVTLTGTNSTRVLDSGARGLCVRCLCDLPPAISHWRRATMVCRVALADGVWRAGAVFVLGDLCARRSCGSCAKI